MKRNILAIGMVMSFFVFSVNAQTIKVPIPADAKGESVGVKSPEYMATFKGEIHPVSVDLKWKPILNNMEVKHHTKDNQQLALIKAQKMLLKAGLNRSTIKEEEHSSLASIITPVVSRGFLGNATTGMSPLDNSIAISNGGKIVSVANASIEYYDADGTNTFSSTILGFFNDGSISVICDPVVIYDSQADAFIFFAQECSGNSGNTRLLIAFSKSNDPNDGWFTYQITGNPAGNNTWFDYPKLAVSNNELYITGNSFSNQGVFQEALLYQIPKSSGFVGANLNYQYWRTIDGNPFTLLPVSNGHQGNYGPGCYLVATNPLGGSTINLYDLTDDMSASNEDLKHYVVATSAYSPSADGKQSGTATLLDNGDCRTLSGFYLNGIIHFVFHYDYTGGFNGINYNRLDIATQKNTSSSFGLSGFEYSYPSVASFTLSNTDKSVMIGFGRTGATAFPEIRTVSCDDGMNWSTSTQVKAGEGYCLQTASGGKPERWGDYTGMCRKHNNSNRTVWMNGMFGTTSHVWHTWISEINGDGGSVGVENLNKDKAIQVSPNPVYDEFITEFELGAKAVISIDIYDIQGKLVKTLYQGTGYSGKNHFTFNKSNLGTGTYFVTITSDHQVLKNEKIIIAD